MAKFSANGCSCPFCGAKNPKWSIHGYYERDLISIEEGQRRIYKITVTRLICSSCKHTHAILPEILIPYGSYSILFILHVLRDYYIKSHTINQICEKYDISVSTLYAWKTLFLIHKKLLLGLLEDSITASATFLSSAFSVNFLSRLKEFFSANGLSFLQGVTKTARSGHS